MAKILTNETMATNSTLMDNLKTALQPFKSNDLTIIVPEHDVKEVYFLLEKVMKDLLNAKEYLNG